MSFWGFVFSCTDTATVKVFILTGSSENLVFYDVNQIVIIMNLNTSVAAEYDLNVFQANLLPDPKKVDMVSQLLKLSNHTGIPWDIHSPRFSAYTWTVSHSKLTPVPNFIHNSSTSNLWNRLIAMTAMSVSAVFNDTLRCPVAEKPFRCKNILKLASSLLHGEKPSISIVRPFYGQFYF